MACSALRLAEKPVNSWMKNVRLRITHWLGQLAFLRFGTFCLI